MADSKKTVLIAAQVDDYQGKLWQVALETQMLEVTVKYADSDLVDLFSSNYQSGIALPDLVLIDTSIKSPNSETLQSGSVCNWCAKNYPAMKIVLFNPRQEKIRDIERTWAIRRGAMDVLPSLTRENLIPSITRITSILSCVSYPELLESIALSMPESTDQSEVMESSSMMSLSSTEKAPQLKGNNSNDVQEEFFIYRGVKVKRTKAG